MLFCSRASFMSDSISPCDAHLLLQIKAFQSCLRNCHAIQTKTHLNIPKITVFADFPSHLLTFQSTRAYFFNLGSAITPDTAPF